MKLIGFLSFGHWTPSPQSQTRSAAGADHRARRRGRSAGRRRRLCPRASLCPSARLAVPALAAIGAVTSRIEIGTAVIDIRYENPLCMAEDADSTDLIAGGRLQLDISRGAPEQVTDGFRNFGYAPPEGESDAEMARRYSNRVALGSDGQKRAVRAMNSIVGKSLTCHWPHT
jgi:alkanesulfonate monooxygenase SsuD/methylene tetrahydromethanopterin reductase-like flavin-dependent oxidoreductase (luciferase family)